MRRSHRSRPRGLLGRTFNRYSLAAAGSFAGQRLAIWAGIELVGLHYQVASSLAAFGSFGALYLLHRAWTFRESR